jgi:hypothetical protein
VQPEDGGQHDSPSAADVDDGAVRTEVVRRDDVSRLGHGPPGHRGFERSLRLGLGVQVAEEGLTVGGLEGSSAGPDRVEQTGGGSVVQAAADLEWSRQTGQRQADRGQLEAPVGPLDRHLLDHQPAQDAAERTFGDPGRVGQLGRGLRTGRQRVQDTQLAGCVQHLRGQ